MLTTAIKKLFGQKKLSPTELTILFGGHSGNSEFIAKESFRYFKQNGINARLADMSKYNFDRLPEENFLLIIVSTHGEGEPPSTAKKFHRKLFADDTPDLKNISFSVCGLGDSSYEKFCQTGKEIDQRLEELGASRFLERVDCDVEFNQTAAQWVSTFLGKYRSGKPKNIAANIQRNNNNEYFGAIVKNRYALDKTAEPLVYHLVLSVDDKNFVYHPGDSVSIVPQNPAELVNTLIKKLGSTPENQVTYKNKIYTLEELLTKKIEITTISKRLLESYLKISKNPELKKLLCDEKEFRNYLETSDVIDLLTDFPWKGNLDELTDIFRPIQPRLYSVASSIKSTPGELHLMIKLICLQVRKRTHMGACSSYLNQWIKPGTRIKLKVIPNKAFRLPQHNQALIMIGAGTGIAPFRAFMQELDAENRNNPAWLIFGEKYAHRNFFYQEEWQDLFNKNTLTRFDVAFSRDSAKKIYVQHQLEKHALLFYEWLENGANVYVCGSVKMGHDVRKAAISCLSEVLQLGKEKATVYLEKLEEDNRWHEDLY
ncbi:diflavin oxidoreductase [Maribellus maritimus]|uniref:diflavin oxidoreductase n=1 Tax=Maribellus maritimus TaxID=2870838 RepID=UPI001EEBC33A|nr:flavodoxin domain-containing protein [Maribellus maritimus]MCG6190638.1 flavodoxin domain-containing protein [Maribellus maritimus]